MIGQGGTIVVADDPAGGILSGVGRIAAGRRGEEIIFMDGRWLVGLLVVVLGMAGAPASAGGGPERQEDAFVARLVRPDRQAAEILALFDGARWSDPAAVLSAWRHRRPETGLGKAIEALIASFNPEMAREWRSMDGARFRIGADPATGGFGWVVVAPRDDGTLAAWITAMRLTNPEDRPIVVDGGEVPVARIGRSGVPLACQVGTAFVVAGSREWLARGAAIATAGDDPGAVVTGDRPEDPASGMVFRLEPSRLPTAPGGSLVRRRAIEAIRASGCRRVEGTASLKDGIVALDVSARFEERGAVARGVERTWLESIPADGVMGAVSMAIDPDRSAWDRAFAAADRVERVDPARAGMAPLRTRLNLLAIGAGVRWESELRPHLRGISACAFADPGRPGRSTGYLVVLHLDDPGIAAGVVRRAGPRLVALALEARDRDIRIAWGDGARPWIGARPGAGRSLSSYCDDRVAEGGGPPSRVGAFWPGRMVRPAGLDGPAGRALADDPPVVWRGWDSPGRSRDVVRWDGLAGRVRGFLAALPADLGPVPAGAEARAGGGGGRVEDSRLND